MGAIGGLAVRMGQMFISGISCSADKPAKLDPKVMLLSSSLLVLMGLSIYLLKSTLDTYRLVMQ